MFRANKTRASVRSWFGNGGGGGAGGALRRRGGERSHQSDDCKYTGRAHRRRVGKRGGSRCPLIRGNVTDKIWSARGAPASRSMAAVVRGMMAGMVCVSVYVYVCVCVCASPQGTATLHRRASERPQANAQPRREALFTAQYDATH